MMVRRTECHDDDGFCILYVVCIRISYNGACRHYDEHQDDLNYCVLEFR